jgi:HEAT repeat protein
MLWWELRQVRSPEPTVREKAVRSLAGRTDAQALSAVLGAKDDSSERVRLAVAQVLGQHPSPEGDRVLRAQLKDVSIAVRTTAAASLAPRAPIDVEGRALWAFASELREEVLALGVDAIPFLTPFMASADRATRNRARELVGAIDYPQDMANLLGKSRDLHLDQDRAADELRARLDQSGDEGIHELARAVQALPDDWDVLGFAMDVLRRLGIRGLPGLVIIANRLGYDHSHERAQVEEAICHLGAPAASQLIATLDVEAAEGGGLVYRVVRRMKDVAIPDMVLALESKEKHVRRFAAEFLDDMRWQPASPRQRALHALAGEADVIDRTRRTREVWLEGLRQLPNDAVREIDAMARDPRFPHRAGAARVLAILDQPMVDLIGDPDPGVAMVAMTASGTKREIRAIDELALALAKGHPGTRDAAARALGEIGTDAVVAPLISAFEHGLEAAAQALYVVQEDRGIDPVLAARIATVLEPHRLATESDRVAAVNQEVRELLAEIQTCQELGDKASMSFHDPRMSAGFTVRRLEQLLETDAARMSSEVLETITALGVLFEQVQREVSDDIRLFTVPMDLSAVRRHAGGELERRSAAVG